MRGCFSRKLLDERQQHVHAALVRSDQHAAALQIAQLANRQLRLFRQPLQPLGVVAQHAPRLGERAVLRRSIEQPLADFLLEAADRLADGRLRAMELGGGARKTALRGHGEKNSQFGQIHGAATINYCYNKFINIDLTISPECRTTVSMATDRVTIFDTTLRDGEQAPGFSLRTSEKVELAKQLDALGVDLIEAGFPIASQDDAEGVQAGGRERPAAGHRGARALPARRHRARRRGAEGRRAVAHPHVHRDLGSAPREEAEHHARAVPRRAPSRPSSRRATTPTTCSSLRKTPRGPTWTFCAAIVEAVIKAGATTINLPDTVGYATPDEIHEFFTTIRATVPNADKAVFSAHCHDDLGLAVANTHAAVTAGVRQVECTINGIGERAGNASLEEIVMGMRVRPDRLPFTTGIRSEQLFPTSQLLSFAHRPARAGQQSHRRTQRLRARGRHPSGRHAQGSPHLRNHEPG